MHRGISFKRIVNNNICAECKTKFQIGYVYDTIQKVVYDSEKSKNGIIRKNWRWTSDQNENLGKYQNEIYETIQNDHYDCLLLFLVILFESLLLSYFL